jgi:hypothetical protein
VPSPNERVSIADRLASLASMVTGDDRHTERMLFLEANGRRYFAVVYLPGPDVEPRATGIVQCHSFGFEQISYRPLETMFARWAVSAGYPVLYSQAQGYGDSDGDFEDVRIATHIRDAGVALDRASELLNIQSIIVQGTRLGALAGAAAASGRANVESLVLWHPVGDPRAFLARMLRAQSATDLLVPSMGLVQPGDDGEDPPSTDQWATGSVDVVGIPVVRGLYEEAERFDLAQAIGSPPVKSLLCEVGRGARARDVIRMEEALRGAGSEVTTVVVPPLPRVEFAPTLPLSLAPEVRLRVFRRVIEATSNWLEANP